MRKSNVLNIVLTVAFFAVFLLSGGIVFNNSYLRFAECLGDLWNSTGYYFCEIFGVEHNILPAVKEYSDVMQWEIMLPGDWQSFTLKAREYFSLLFSDENFAYYIVFLGDEADRLSRIIAVFLPCVVIIFFALKKLYSSENTHYGKDSFPLLLYKRALSLTYFPIKKVVLSYVEFLKSHKVIILFWVVIWLFNLNIMSIVTEFFAFYLWFAVTYDLMSLYTQVCKLLIDLQVVFTSVPWWILLAFGYLLLEKLRRNIGLDKLRHYEARNCGFIKELPIVTLVCGTMGSRKTTLITDMALSEEVMLRQKALELLQKNDMRFPHFPWILFEKELQKCMEFGSTYSLATVREFVNKKKERFGRHKNTKWQLYGYNYEYYGLKYDDGLRVWDLFEVLHNYALLYFVYVMQSSLIVSNYAIRESNLLSDSGNFPLWNTNFFTSNISENGRFAHILDFDVLRLGKRVIENNPNAGSFEFGIVVISEIGKERGNNLELRETKKFTNEANQKNDLFNSWLKMCRHSANIDNFPFIKVFCDEQRPESWGADARDLSDILTVIPTGKENLALPFYTIEDMLSEWAFVKFMEVYKAFRFRRGDNTLFMYLLKTVTAMIYKRHVKIYNEFGYSTVLLEKERGTMKGKIQRKKYYLMNKKIYSRRFSTDCFSDYFNALAMKSKVGLNDYREYATERATIDELKQQNSYFIQSLYKDAGSD